MLVTTPYVESMTGKIKQESNFDYAMRIVKEHEGGLSDNKNDPGGITNYGISLRYIKAENIDIDGDGDSDRDDIIRLTQTKADKIYLKNWWIKYHYDRIKNKAVSTKIMDLSINAGSFRAHVLAKKALNSIYPIKISINGVLDEYAIKLINNTESFVMMDSMRNQEELFYRAIVKKNKNMQPFLKGWLNRAKW